MPIDTNIRVTDEINGDYWFCSCGNRADISGFNTTDLKGCPIEPRSMWKDLYMCRRCGKIYDLEGELVGQSEAKRLESEN